MPRDDSDVEAGLTGDALQEALDSVAERLGLSADAQTVLKGAAQTIIAQLTWGDESGPLSDASASAIDGDEPGLSAEVAGGVPVAPPPQATAPPRRPVSDRRAARETPLEGLPGRYEDLGWINAGGMGEIRRVRDRDLNRTLVMKLIHLDQVSRGGRLARFVEEAQITAQLSHPGVVPVHEIGQLADGRIWFTMKEIQGRTLSDVIRELHAASADGWRAGPSGWTLRRLVSALQRACEAIGYAHSRGVVHRDVKPDNVMLGPFGEVLVLDWGLTRLFDASESGPELEVDEHGATRTRYGTVSGTPAYMPPEQARGEVDRMGPPVDVYALGATLYQLITGRTPYDARDAVQMLRAVLAGPPRPPEERGGPPIPEGLSAICLRAMARDPAARYPNAAAMGEAIGAWLDGAAARARALELVETADAEAQTIGALRADAAALRVAALQLLKPLRPSDPVSAKRSGWLKEDEADRLERAAERLETERVQRLQAALTYDPGLPEAHERLAALYQARHMAAEERGDARASDRAEILLRTHDRGTYAAWLAGRGWLDLETEPAGAEATIFRYVSRDRRLVPELTLGPMETPLRDLSLPAGRYLVELRAPGRPGIRYPVEIRREERWCVSSPDGDALPVRLPEALGPGEIYVSAGWFRCGGDPTAYFALPGRRIWCDSFVIQRFSVTNRQYIEFLDDLLAQGREEDALRWAPRERATRPGEVGEPSYARRANGGFTPAPDAEGDVWDLDWPVFNIDWTSAAAYARWLAERDGLPWRLPTELEWEKAARGVDGRIYPWGDFFDATWCCVRSSHPGRPLPAVVDSYPVDESPYGARGMAGNVREWCINVFESEPAPVERASIPPLDAGDNGTQRALRGGGWYFTEISARTAGRYGFAQENRTDSVGFRLARSV